MFEIRRKPGVQIAEAHLGPVLVRFQTDGLAVDAHGRTALPAACAESARAYPAAFEVKAVAGALPAAQCVGEPAFWRMERGVLLPPRVEDLVRAGVSKPIAAQIAELESYAASLGLFPYGPRPRAPVGVDPHPTEGNLSDAMIADGAESDADVPEAAGTTDEVTPARVEPLTGSPMPPVPPSYEEAIEAALAVLLEKHGGGNRLRDVVDALGLKGVGQSKPEMAEGIRTAAKGGPDVQRRVYDLLTASGEIL